MAEEWRSTILGAGTITHEHANEIMETIGPNIAEAIRALPASDAPVSPWPKVKALVWSTNHRHEESSSGYVVLPHPCATGLWCLDVFGRRLENDFPSPAAAKSAAQADHEARILSALDLPTLPQPKDEQA